MNWPWPVAISIPSVRADQTDAIVKLGLTINRTGANEIPGTISETNSDTPHCYYFYLTVVNEEILIPAFVKTRSGDSVLDYDPFDPSQTTSAMNLHHAFSKWAEN